MEIVTRAEAQSQGLPSYFTGKACKQGHIARRQTSGGNCLECREAWLAENGSAVEGYKQDWLTRNPKRRREVTAQYRTRTVEARRAYNKTFREANLAYYAAKAAERRAAKLMATPPWADANALERFYLECPKGYEVDHVIPLKHPLICGLHVVGNLQYLTPKQNRMKSNSWPHTLLLQIHAESRS